MKGAFILTLLSILLISLYFSIYREGWEPIRSYYNSELGCDEFCAKIKTENKCIRFNDDSTIKCKNNKGLLISPICYLHKNKNCMSMV
jgi:hypothetical protein